MCKSIFDWGAWSCLLFALTAVAETSFLSPSLQNAEAEALRRQLATYGDSSPQSELEQAMRWLALGALESEAGHPHAAHRAWNRVEDFCVGWRMTHYASLQGALAARAASVCALAGAERTAQGLPWLHYFAGKRLASDTQAILLGDADEAERLHVTGRLRSALSPAFGQDFRTALISWRVLERTAPTAPGTDYWLALTLERQGNTLAKESFEKASKLTPADPRAQLRAKRPEGQSMDALDYGLSPAFSSGPARGMGIGLRAWDDRIADQRHSVAAGVQAATRGNLWGGVQLTEAEWIAPLKLDLHFTASDRLRDYFGLGVNTLYAGAVEFRTREWDLEALLALPLGPWEFAAGVATASFSSDPLPAGVVGQSLQGIVAQVSWDKRDRPVAPRAGYFAKLRQEWRFNSAGTLFTRTRLQGAAHFRLNTRHTLHWNAVLLATDGTVPFNALSDLYDTDLPAVREYRWLESQAAATWVSYRYQVLAWLRVGAFGSLGAAAADLGSLAGATRWGAGLELQFISERAPRFAPLWTLGIFNREWTFQGGMRAEF